jgi:prepilin peptidase CpaA
VTWARRWAVQTAVVVVGIGILALIAYRDVRTRRIPNPLAIAIAILGLVRILLVNDPVAAGYTLAAGIAMLAVAFLLFWRGVLGGVDAKLIAATVLLIGYQDLFGFLFLMSLCGAALALATLTRDKLGPWLWSLWLYPAMSPVAATAAPKRSTVPYGAAIAAAGVIVLILETS